MVFLSQIPTEGYLCSLLYYTTPKGERVDFRSDRLQVPIQAVSLLAPAFWMNYSFTLGNTLLIGKAMAFLIHAVKVQVLCVKCGTRTWYALRRNESYYSLLGPCHYFQASFLY